MVHTVDAQPLRTILIREGNVYVDGKQVPARQLPASLDTRAEVDLSTEGGPSLSAIRLRVTGKVPGLDAAGFRAIADDAGRNCPVSRALSAVPITVEAELAS